MWEYIYHYTHPFTGSLARWPYNCVHVSICVWNMRVPSNKVIFAIIINIQPENNIFLQYLTFCLPCEWKTYAFLDVRSKSSFSTSSTNDGKFESVRHKRMNKPRREVGMLVLPYAFGRSLLQLFVDWKERI